MTEKNKFKISEVERVEEPGKKKSYEVERKLSGKLFQMFYAAAW